MRDGDEHRAFLIRQAEDWLAVLVRWSDQCGDDDERALAERAVRLQEERIAKLRGNGQPAEPPEHRRAGSSGKTPQRGAR